MKRVKRALVIQTILTVVCMSVVMPLAKDGFGYVVSWITGLLLFAVHVWICKKIEEKHK